MISCSRLASFSKPFKEVSANPALVDPFAPSAWVFSAPRTSSPVLSSPSNFSSIASSSSSSSSSSSEAKLSLNNSASFSSKSPSKEAKISSMVGPSPTESSSQFCSVLSSGMVQTLIHSTIANGSGHNDEGVKLLLSHRLPARPVWPFTSPNTCAPCPPWFEMCPQQARQTWPRPDVSKFPSCPI